MKKITFRLLMFFLLLVSGIMNAQFTQGFEAGIPGTWTVINGGDANTFTAATPGTGTAHTGTNVAKLVYSAAAHDDYLITQQFTVTAGTSDQISLWYKHRSNSFPEIFSVLLSSTGVATTDFTTTIAATVTPTTAWQQVSYNLSAYIGQTVYIAFRSTTTDQWELYLDDIVVDAAPVPCTGTPTAGTVTPALQNLCTGSTPANLVGAGFSSGVTGLTFQWEESNDNGVGDAWANAVGGTGATTATYTPPAFSGTQIYYRLKVTCTGSGLSSQTASVVVSPPANPSTQVTAVAQGAATLTTIPLNWVNGNGGRRVVYFSNTATFTDPVNGNAPALTAAAAYAGPGQQIVYDGTGTAVTVTGLTSGTTYYVKVYEYLRCGAGPYDYYYNVSTGTNIQTVTTAAPPVNDNFANAIAIACGNNYTGITNYATIDEANATLQFGVDLDSPNVWYKYTGSGAAQTVTLNLCGSNYDSSVLVLTGSSGALTAVAGNDDDATGCAPNGTRSKVNFTSDGTTTYYIAIEGYNPTSVGMYTMDVTCAAVNPPAVSNQDCVTSLAVNVNGTDNASDNSYGNVSSAQPTCDQFGSIQDVWFSFVAPSSGSVDCLVTNGTMTSSNFSVYSGTCGALVEVAGTCNSNLTTPTTESLTGLTVGNTYYVQVWSNAAEQGTFTLRLTDTALNTPSFDKNSFLAYPNPVKDILNLSYSKEISNVSVHNLLGQTVMAKTLNSTHSQLDLSGLSNGTYLVKVTVDNLVKTIKVVKE